MKKTALLALLLLLALTAATASALTLTGPETESVSRYWEESQFFPRMEALTGVAMEPKALQEQEEYDKLLSGMLSGRVTADVLFKAELSRDEERALLDAGAILDLAPLIGENMPNLSALLDAHPEWREVISLPDGRIASLPLLNENERQVCVWINRAWLDKLGLAMPTTLDELTEALAQMAVSDPNGNYKSDEVGADLVGVWEMRWLLPYFGIVADDYNIARVDGRAVFAPELDGYRDFVTLLHDWVERGILPETAFTDYHSTALLNSSSSDDTPETSGLLVSMTPFTQVDADDVTDYEALLMAGPDGETVWRDLLGDVWTGCYAVTSACEDPAAALRWVDALYSEEGALLGYAGVEGEDYTYSAEGYWTFSVDTMRTIDDIRAQVLMYTGTTMPGLTPSDFLLHVDSEADRHVFSQSMKVKAVATQVTPAYALDTASQQRADELAATLCRLVDEGIARFATGEVPLDDAHWDAWLAQLRDAGSEELAQLFGTR